jgi:hypothetical protein
MYANCDCAKKRGGEGEEEGKSEMERGCESRAKEQMKACTHNLVHVPHINSYRFRVPQKVCASIKYKI